MKKFFYSLYYSIYSINDGHRTPSIIALLISFNVYSILRFFTGLDSAFRVSLILFLVLSIFIGIVDYFKEKEIIEFCEKHPTDYKVYATAYIIVSVLFVILTSLLLNR